MIHNHLTKTKVQLVLDFISLANRPERNVELATVNRWSWTEYVAQMWERLTYVDNDASLTFARDMTAYPVNLKRPQFQVGQISHSMIGQPQP
jgi:hypothetical protein